MTVHKRPFKIDNGVGYTQDVFGRWQMALDSELVAHIVDLEAQAQKQEHRIAALVAELADCEERHDCDRAILQARTQLMNKYSQEISRLTDVAQDVLERASRIVLERCTDPKYGGSCVAVCAEIFAGFRSLSNTAAKDTTDEKVV